MSAVPSQRFLHRLGPILGVILATLLLIPTFAHAHASLTSSTPTDGAQLDSSPTELTLTFSAPIEAQEDAVQLFGPNTSTRRPTVRTADRTLLVELDDPLERGTWAYAYRVTSIDGHAVTGSGSFTVGDKSAGDGAAKRLSEQAALTPRWVTISFAASRGVLFLGLLSLVGGGIFSLLLAPDWRPRLLLTWWMVTLVGAVASYLADAAWQLGLDPGELARESALRAELGTPYGRAMAVVGATLLLALIPVVLVRGHRPPSGSTRWLLVPPFIVLGSSLALAGHAIEAGPVSLRAALDALHLIAAAFWTGSLVQLWFMARDGTVHADAIVRFSRIAIVAVGVLLATGVYATWYGASLTPSELLASRYGHIIAGKVVLLCAIAPLAVLNKRTFVPALESGEPHAADLLRAYTLRELALVLAAIGLTSWLVLTPPPA